MAFIRLLLRFFDFSPIFLVWSPLNFRFLWGNYSWNISLRSLQYQNLTFTVIFPHFYCNFTQIFRHVTGESEIRKIERFLLWWARFLADTLQCGRLDCCRCLAFFYEHGFKAGFKRKGAGFQGRVVPTSRPNVAVSRQRRSSCLWRSFAFVPKLILDPKAGLKTSRKRNGCHEGTWMHLWSQDSWIMVNTSVLQLKLPLSSAYVKKLRTRSRHTIPWLFSHNSILPDLFGFDIVDLWWLGWTFRVQCHDRWKML